MIRNLYLLLFFSFLLTSCGHSGKGIFSSEKKQVRTTANNLLDSMNLAWEEMIQSDDKKIADIKRLLDEVSYTQSHDTATLEKLKAAHARLKSIRYRAENMSSAAIDAYDMATDSLVREAIDLSRSTPEMSAHTITDALINDIMYEDSRVILYRVKYDRWAKEYNHFLSENREMISRLGSPYNELQKRPIFELAE